MGDSCSGRHDARRLFNLTPSEDAATLRATLKRNLGDTRQVVASDCLSAAMADLVEPVVRVNMTFNRRSVRTDLRFQTLKSPDSVAIYRLD